MGNRFQFLCVFLLFTAVLLGQHPFYVDPKAGSDHYPGTLSAPFRSLEKALEVVDARVREGILSDTIYLRGGVYRKSSSKTLYRINLQGEMDRPAVLSAMPCRQGDPEGVRHKSGRWYERVVFDDAWIVDSPWEKLGDSGIWKTVPGYVQLEWTHRNLWPWTKYGYPTTPNDSTPETTLFTVAPYMLLQDGDPSIYAEGLSFLTEEGRHWYNQESGELFLRPYSGMDPNLCKIETWYGGFEDYENGTLHLDGEGRAIFVGNMNHAVIRGFEFRMFNKIFEFHRRKYDREEDRIIQRHVAFEDNICRYGWIQILLDANTVHEKDSSLIQPDFGDRANWTVRNNVFYRPAREVCQLHGPDHLIEYNDIIEHGGPWAGPAAIVSVINTRNTRNAVIRNNFILGHGNNPWHDGSVFMIEVHGMVNGHNKGGHTGPDGKYIYGGQTFENNLIANTSRGMAVFVLAKGNIMLRDVCIRNNVIYNAKDVPVVLVMGPHEHLVIEQNLFYACNIPFRIEEAAYGSRASSVRIRSNIFHECIRGIPPALDRSAHEGSRVSIDNNLYSQVGGEAFGGFRTRATLEFEFPEKFDFRMVPRPDFSRLLQSHGLHMRELTDAPPGWRDLFEYYKPITESGDLTSICVHPE